MDVSKAYIRQHGCMGAAPSRHTWVPIRISGSSEGLCAGLLLLVHLLRCGRQPSADKVRAGLSMPGSGGSQGGAGAISGPLPAPTCPFTRDGCVCALGGAKEAVALLRAVPKAPSRPALRKCFHLLWSPHHLLQGDCSRALQAPSCVWLSHHHCGT